LASILFDEVVAARHSTCNHASRDRRREFNHRIDLERARIEMPLFVPSQNKWLETSLLLRNVIFPALVKAAVHGTWWGCRCLAVLALMGASAQTSRAQDGIACITKADTVDTGAIADFW
jgi:hypothetical protein